MKKLTYSWIGIELTRRCNIACEHCMRGDAQNIDIDEGTIDSFLDQTQIIGKLAFEGGEPTLCIDKMKYILDGMKKRNILLFELEITTNGYKKIDDFVDVVQEYGEYIKYCWDRPDIKLPYYIKINVSVDKYHALAGNYQPEESYWWYKVRMHNIAKVDRLTNGAYPKKKGRAINLSEAVDVDYSFRRNDKRVEILSKDMKPCCPNYKSYKLLFEDQVYIVCNLVITAKGDMTFFIFADDIWDIEDNNTICNVNDDIYEQILEFNKGKLTCVQYMKREQREDAERSMAFVHDNADIIIANGDNLSNYFARSFIDTKENDPTLHYDVKAEKVTYTSDYGNLEEAENHYLSHNYNYFEKEKR